MEIFETIKFKQSAWSFQTIEISLEKRVKAIIIFMFWILSIIAFYQKMPFYRFIPFSWSGFKVNQLCFSLENFSALFLNTFSASNTILTCHLHRPFCWAGQHDTTLFGSHKYVKNRKCSKFLAPWNIFGIDSRAIQNWWKKFNYFRCYCW